MKTLKEIREANHFSQVEFAEYLGMSRRSYQMKETGELPLTQNEIIKAAKLNKGTIRVLGEDGYYDIKVI